MTDDEHTDMSDQTENGSGPRSGVAGGCAQGDDGPEPIEQKLDPNNLRGRAKRLAKDGPEGPIPLAICPVCDGSGAVPARNLLPYGEECDTCFGEGVVRR
jgi:hypothetical protein